MQTCPCCDGTGEIPEDFRLTRQQQMIFDAVKARPRSSLELADIVYADDPDGGPENADRVVWVQVWQMNKKFAKYGFRLRGGGGRGGSPYRMEKISA